MARRGREGRLIADVERACAQDTFDQAVAENQAEFDMDVDEAVRSAVEEFQAQHVDLTDVLRVAPCRRNRKATWLTWIELERDLQAGSEANARADRMRDLHREIRISTSKEEDVLQLTQADALAKLLAFWKAFRGQEVGMVHPLLELSSVLLVHAINKETFCKMEGPAMTLQFLRQDCVDAEGLVQGMHVVATACRHHEKNKAAFMEGGIADAIVEALRRRPCAEDGILRATCAALKAITSADDESALTSDSFKFARELAQADVHVHLLRCMASERVEDVGSRRMELLCDSLRRVCVNEEICKATVEEQDVLAIVLPMLRENADEVGLVVACLKLLRQLAGSDPVKARLVQNHVLELLQALLAGHAAHANLVECAVGLLAVLCLRNPETASMAAKEDTAGTVVEIMELHAKNGRVQRSCCMAVRNMVARNEGSRALWLESGIEPMLRKAKIGHPHLCEDVGSAALRDLGFDDYNAA